MTSLLGGSSSGSLLGGSSSGGSVISSSSGGMSPLMAMLAQRAYQRPEEDESGGLMGLLGNAWEGITGTAEGVVKGITGGILHDVGQVVGNVAAEIPGVDEIEAGIINSTEDRSKLLELGKGIAGAQEVNGKTEWNPLNENAVLGNIYHRWKPLFTGDIGEFGENLYEDPLGAVLDVASLASGGAALAGKVGAAGKLAKAMRLPGAVDDLGAVGTAARTLEELSGRVSSRTARSAAMRAGMESEGLGSVLQRGLLPKAGYKLVEGEGLVPTASMYNPLFRATVGKPLRRLTTESLDDFAARGGSATQVLKEMPAALKNLGDVDKFDTIYKAAEALDMKRIEKPYVASKLASLESSKLYAHLSGRHYATRNRRIRDDPYLKELQRIQDKYGDDFDPDEAFDHLHGARTAAQDVTGLPLRPEAFATRQGYGEGQAGNVVLGAPDRDFGARIPSEGNPLRTRGEEALGVIDELRQKYTSERAMHEAGETDVDSLLQSLDVAENETHLALDRAARAETGEFEMTPYIELTDSYNMIDITNNADAMRTGVTNALDMLDRRMRPWQSIYGREKDWSGESPTGYTGGPDLFESAKAFQNADVPLPAYMPHMDVTKLSNKDFFAEKSPIGANIRAKNPDTKEMKLVLFKHGTASKDLKDVMTRRVAREVREEESYGMWKTIMERFGTPITEAEMVPSGYKLMAPDLLFINQRSRVKLLNRIDENISKGMDRDSAFAKAMKETLDENYDNVKAIQEAGDIKMYAVPEVVLKKLDQAARYSPAFGGKGVQLSFDQVMNVWRGLTLTASPRWVVNNVLGNVGFGLMQGVKTADVMRIGGEKFRVLMQNYMRRKMGKPEVAGPREKSLAYETKRLMEKGDVEAGHGITTSIETTSQHLGREAAETGLGKAELALANTRFARRTKSMGAAMKSLNGTIEDAFREASFLTAIEKGQGIGAIRRTGRSFWRSKERIDKIMRDGFSEATAKMGMKEMEHFFGNYSGMTPFERHVIRRWVAPFWSFYRHSSKLMLSFPFEYPGRATIFQGIARVNQELEDQYGPRPSWLEGALGLGEDQFMTTRGLDPFSGAAEGLPGIANMLGPLPKAVIEQSTGESLFTGEPFTDRNVIENYGGERMRIIYDDDGNPIGAEPVEKVAPSLLNQLVNTVPQMDILKDVIAGGNVYDTASLADAIQQRFGDAGEATPLDPETGEPFSPTGLAEAISKMMGMPTTTYDLQAYQQRLLEQQSEAINAAYERMQLEGSM